jgi:hypothetical protein
MGFLYWPRRLGIVMMIAYGAWMLKANVDRVEIALGPNLGRHEESRPDKLGGTALEQKLIESNAFGKATLARPLWCERHSAEWFPRWDYICQIGGGLDRKTHQLIPGGMKFGLLVDAEHITAMSDLYPAESGIPRSAQTTTLSPNEPAREELACGGPNFSATYFPATKLFGPALNVKFQPTRGFEFRISTEPGAMRATDAAVRACIQFIEGSKALAQQLPATAWENTSAWDDAHHVRHSALLPGGAEHLVFDPQTKQVQGWTRHDGLRSPEL